MSPHTNVAPGSDAAVEEWPAAKLFWTTLGVLAIALAFGILLEMRWVIFVFLLAVMIGTALAPLAKRLQRLGLSQVASVVLLYIALGLVVVAFVVAFMPLIIDQIVAISTLLPEYYQSLRQSLINSPIIFVQQLAVRLPNQLGLGGVTSGTGALPEGTNLAPLLAGVGLGARSAYIALATLLLSFNWMLEGQRAIRTLLILLPPRRRGVVEEVVGELQATVGAYVRSQAILVLIVGAMALVAYLLIGLPYAFVLALFAGLMEAVPLIGPFLGALPALLVAATLEPSLVVWVLVATVVIQQIENTVLVPRVMKRTVGVNPVVALVALFTFGSLYGLVGVLLAVPIAAIMQTMLDRYLSSPATAESVETTDRGRATLLRYHLRDLIFDIQKQEREADDEMLELEEQSAEEQMEAIAADLERLISERARPEGTAS